jgi:alkylation response protein AidB-like acyl-CoA dehydrogenase
MDFRFDDEQVAVRDAVRAFCAQHYALAQVGEREGRAALPETWTVLAGMGFFALLRPGDRGFGGGMVEAAIVSEELGAHLATGPLLWSAIAAVVVDDAADGATRVTGLDVTAPAVAPFVVEHPAEADVLLIVRDDAVERCPTRTLADPIDGAPFDPLTPALAFPALPRGDVIGGPGEAALLRRAGAIIAAAQLVGVAQGALDVATNYARERQQFGVPIGSFQAVKHLLADMYVRTELARSATYAAAALYDDPPVGDAASATSAAKLLAGEAALANGRTAVQVLGGMGFTWEMAPHYFLKRAWVLEQSFGTGDDHALAMSAALEAGARPPAGSWT